MNETYWSIWMFLKIGNLKVMDGLFLEIIDKLDNLGPPAIKKAPFKINLLVNH